MLLELLFQELKKFKSAFKQIIEMIFSSIVPELARFEKLLNIICAQIDELDEKNVLLCCLKPIQFTALFEIVCIGKEITFLKATRAA
ncbi:ATP-binding Cassette (ABC) Superfamily [Trachipleistophora hominis]|uniref:ATP-binding Cassette (ABC) Superfamily n=1 Tax=Trachipleistophora hominis TaxID=72359 RepID=L7JTH6_TRAHO|nr:ATP-binding Cassette (ABC) Superfamily [Trachipleistophora hominis]